VHAIYSILTDTRNDVVIEGYKCISLAHGNTEDAVASHPFFGTCYFIILHLMNENETESLSTLIGTDKVLDAMQQHEGFKEGHVTIKGITLTAFTLTR
jgi:hypothetical protein